MHHASPEERSPLRRYLVPEGDISPKGRYLPECRVISFQKEITLILAIQPALMGGGEKENNPITENKVVVQKDESKFLIRSV